MTKRVLHDRSVVMAFRMQRELRRGDAFVALGALHLYGDKGVLGAARARRLPRRAGLLMLVVVLISGRGSNMRRCVEAGLAGQRRDQQPRRRRRASSSPRSRHRHRGRGAPAASPTREAFDAALARRDRSLRAAPGRARRLHARARRRASSRAIASACSTSIRRCCPRSRASHTHERALAAGVKLHGCTVHFVTAELDRGPIVIQAAVPVRPATRRQRSPRACCEQEHVIYPRAARWFLDGRLVIDNGVVRR